MMKRTMILILMTILPVAGATAPAAAFLGDKSEINTTWGGVAVKGYDPVAYFTEGRPVKGKAEFEFEWKGAKWRFASAAHRDMFKAAPETYAPQYGGY